MIQCWIDGQVLLSHGQIIEIRRGIRNNNIIRVARFYSHTHKSIFTSRINGIGMVHPPQQFDPVIIGMVTDINSRENRTDFNLHQIRGNLPPFNTDGGPLTKTFISSKMGELDDERIQTALGICEAISQPVYFEGFPPESRPSKEVMIDELDECHIYVGIFGSDYSSATIDEYNRAGVLGRQRLCFIKKVDEREGDLEKFLKELRKDVTYQRFTSAGELKTLVRDAVSKAIEDLFE